MTIGWQLLTLTHTLSAGAQRLNRSRSSRLAADRLGERLRSDATAAWSLFVPPADRFGRTNSDGHELDFVTEDARHRTLWWAYVFDSSARRVIRYGYDPGGTLRAGEAYDGIDRFSAAAYPITDVVRPESPVYDPLFAGAGVTAVDVPFGWRAGVSGGNRLTDVRYRGGGSMRDEPLASGASPSRFTVVFFYTPPPSAAP